MANNKDDWVDVTEQNDDWQEVSDDYIDAGTAAPIQADYSGEWETSSNLDPKIVQFANSLSSKYPNLSKALMGVNEFGDALNEKGSALATHGVDQLAFGHLPDFLKYLPKYGGVPDYALSPEMQAQEQERRSTVENVMPWQKSSREYLEKSANDFSSELARTAEESPITSFIGDIGGMVMSPINKILAPIKIAQGSKVLTESIPRGVAYGAAMTNSESTPQDMLLNTGLGGAAELGGALISKGISKIPDKGKIGEYYQKPLQYLESLYKQKGESLAPELKTGTQYIPKPSSKRVGDINQKINELESRSITEDELSSGLIDTDYFQEELSSIKGKMDDNKAKKFVVNKLINNIDEQLGDIGGKKYNELTTEDLKKVVDVMDVVNKVQGKVSRPLESFNRYIEDLSRSQSSDLQNKPIKQLLFAKLRQTPVRHIKALVNDLYDVERQSLPQDIQDYFAKSVLTKQDVESGRLNKWLQEKSTYGEAEDKYRLFDLATDKNVTGDFSSSRLLNKSELGDLSSSGNTILYQEPKQLGNQMNNLNPPRASMPREIAEKINPQAVQLFNDIQVLGEKSPFFQLSQKLGHDPQQMFEIYTQYKSNPALLNRLLSEFDNPAVFKSLPEGDLIKLLKDRQYGAKYFNEFATQETDELARKAKIEALLKKRDEAVAKEEFMANKQRERQNLLNEKKDLTSNMKSVEEQNQQIMGLNEQGFQSDIQSQLSPLYNTLGNIAEGRSYIKAPGMLENVLGPNLGKLGSIPLEAPLSLISKNQRAKFLSRMEPTFRRWSGMGQAMQREHNSSKLVMDAAEQAVGQLPPEQKSSKAFILTLSPEFRRHVLGDTTIESQEDPEQTSP